jgi:tetratricopeptide (TPR) repeat protein
VRKPEDSADIDSLWEYTDPAASEALFRRALFSARGDEALELRTQIARTYGLRGRFAEAHDILDGVQGQLAGAGLRPRLRYLLERGRTLNSDGHVDQARSLFLEAWELASAAGYEGLAVDAAHMVAITLSGRPEAIAWNRRGLDLARTSRQPKALALIPAMLNNSAWDLHDMGRFAEALPMFEEALAEWSARGQDQQILAARWAVARCLRSLERSREALGILRDLEAEHASRDSVDGFVFEEMAENLAALGRLDEARPYFGKAFDVLSHDDWMANNEGARLAHLKSQAAEDAGP